MERKEVEKIRKVKIRDAFTTENVTYKLYVCKLCGKHLKSRHGIKTHLGIKHGDVISYDSVKNERE